MSFPRYPRYKDSGVEWLGGVPEHWQLMALTRVTKSKCDGPFGSGIKSEHYTDEGAFVVRLQNIRADGFYVNEAAFLAEDYFQGELFRHNVLGGDILIAGLGDDNNVVGRACVAPANLGSALVKADCFRFRVNTETVEPAFIAMQLTSGARYDAGRMSGGSTRSRIPLGTMASRSICFPSVDEQITILAFLENEVLKIDALIEEQQRLIELLKEKRQAMISQAVTKGLDPSVPMKDSGVEWLGQVPENWGILPLKHIVSTPITDGPHETPEFPNEGIPFVSAEAVSGGVLNFERIRGFISEADHLRYSKKYKPMRGDIFMIKSGATTGTTAIVETDTEFNIWSPLAAIRCDKGYSPRFVLNFMRSKNFLEAVSLNWSFGTQQNIGMGVIENLPISAPPIEEQERIANYLTRVTAELDALAREAGQAEIILTERRSALISAAVTGKIDVRGFVPAQPGSVAA